MGFGDSRQHIGGIGFKIGNWTNRFFQIHTHSSSYSPNSMPPAARGKRGKLGKRWKLGSWEKEVNRNDIAWLHGCMDIIKLVVLGIVIFIL
jgi:hypothetical protein